jgi:hypothetical protein
MGSKPFTPIMVPPTAGIVGMGTQKARQATDVKNREHNDNFIFTGDANLRHTPAYYIGIFNVSDQEQRIERPWVMPGKVGKVLIVPACEAGKKFSRPFLIPDIVQMPVDRVGSWELGTRGVDGKFLAQDAVNPEDPSGNWKTVRTVLETSLANEGTNLYHLGLFWATCGAEGKDAPPDDAIAMAVSRLEATYNKWIDEANLLALQGADGIRQIGATHHRAANYFPDNSFTWNTRYEKKNKCSNCGTAIPVTASRCYQCKHVISWERAIAEGTATVAEAIAAGVMQAQAEDLGKRAGKKKAAQKQP